MIIGCEKYYEGICPDFPDKCHLCGNFIDNRKDKKMQYYIQYREGGTKRWKFVKSELTRQRLKFWERRDAQRCMERVFNSGYDAQIVVFEKKMKWIERKER